MPIRFNTPGGQRPKMYHILIPEVGINYIASIASDQRKHRAIEVHYDKTIGRTVPCQQEECMLCTKYIPVREVVYVPALVFKGPKVGFTAEILAVTDSWREILNEDLRRWLFTIKRKGGKQSTILWERKEEKDADVGEFAGFDIEHSLYRAWGLRNWQWGDPGKGAP